MVSIIIVVYNASKFLKYAIESVLNQTYKDLEIIAVDDGSTDTTLEILKEYAKMPNFTLIIKKHNKNLGGNRNEAIKLAKGDTIAFIDGDDIWERNKLEVQMPYLKKFDMVCSNALLINENNNITSDSHSNKFKNDAIINLEDLVSDNFIIVSSVLIKKSAVINSGYFEDGPDTRAEDYVLWLNYLKNNSIKYINKPLLRYRIHSENWSNSNIEDWIRLLKRTIDIRYEYLNNANIEVRKSASKGSFISCLELAKINYRNRNFKSASNYLKKAIGFYDSKFSMKYAKYVIIYIYISLLSVFKK